MKVEGSHQATSLESAIQENWSRWFGEPPPPTSLVVSGTGRPRAQTSVAIYALDRRTGAPRVMVKVNRSRHFGNVTSEEFEYQRAAFDVMEPVAPGTVARPLDLIDIGGDLCLVSEFVDGEAMAQGRAVSGQMERAMAGWLKELHQRSTRTSTGADSGPIRTVVDSFTDTFGPGAGVSARLREAAEAVGEERGASDEEMIVHGDFWDGNWLIAGDSFTIIDWEYAHRSTSPMMDEFLHPLSRMDPQADANIQALRRFSDLYRGCSGRAPRSDESVALAAVWVAASVATRTVRRWGVAEEWSFEWARKTDRLASMA